LHKPNVLVSRFLNGFGGFTDGINDYSTAALTTVTPHVVGSIAGNDQQTVWPVVLAHTKLVVLWGADLIQNNQIDFVVPDHYVYQALPRLKAAGTRVISINPYRTDTDEYLNAEWVPIRPCTDVAMMLGIAHTLYTEKLHDQHFLDTYTTGFAKFKAYLLGESDGTPKNPAWAEKICGVPRGTIAALARDMAKTRTMLMGGWAIQRQDHGEQPPWMLITLAAMLGQIGLPGGGFGFSYHASSGGAPTTVGPVLAGIPNQTDAKRALPTRWHGNASHAVPISRFVDMLRNPGKHSTFDGGPIVYPDIKLIYWAGGNAVNHQPQLNELVEALRRPQTIIVHEVFWTPTAKFADIVLPISTTFERNDIASIGLFSNQGYVAMKKAIEPLFEARTDYAIFADLAERLHFKAGFTEGRDEMAWLRYFYNTARKAGAAKKVAMPDFDTFWRQGLLEFAADPSQASYVTYADYRQDPQSNPLNTPSGKIEIYSTKIAGFHYADCPPQPTWLEPVEWLGSSHLPASSLALINPHPKYRLHSQLDNTDQQRLWNKPRDRAPIWINPRDAHARGLKNDDIVRVHNSRGQALAGVVVTDRVMPGVVRMEEGTWYNPQIGGKIGALDVEGSPNTVTLDRGTSSLAQGPIVNSTIVMVEKYAGPVPPVTAYRAPAGQ
jgi:trimethylamine-N-oxide reductase (cytochrome c)